MIEWGPLCITDLFQFTLIFPNFINFQKIHEKLFASIFMNILRQGIITILRYDYCTGISHFKGLDMKNLQYEIRVCKNNHIKATIVVWSWFEITCIMLCYNYKFTSLQNFSDKLKRLRPQLMKMYQGSSRDSRSMKNYVQRPEMTRNQLMNYHVLASQGRIEEISRSIREKRQGKRQI